MGWHGCSLVCDGCALAQIRSAVPRVASTNSPVYNCYRQPSRSMMGHIEIVREYVLSAAAMASQSVSTHLAPAAALIKFEEKNSAFRDK